MINLTTGSGSKLRLLESGNSHKSLDCWNTTVRADFALRGLEKIVGVVMGKSRFEDGVDKSLVCWAKLARAGFNCNDIEVEFSGDDVSANVFDNPVVIVGGYNLELRVGVTVSNIG